jgi:hypothetical protein
MANGLKGIPCRKFLNFRRSGFLASNKQGIAKVDPAGREWRKRAESTVQRKNSVLTKVSSRSGITLYCFYKVFIQTDKNVRGLEFAMKGLKLAPDSLKEAALRCLPNSSSRTRRCCGGNQRRQRSSTVREIDLPPQSRR